MHHRRSKLALTDDHQGEKVSVEEVEEEWLVPRFHANHRGDHINQRDGLKRHEKITFNWATVLLLILLYCWSSAPHHLADVVAPRQKQDARVVFLPVGQNEREEHHPQDVVEYGNADAAFPAPKYGVDGGHEEDAGPAVQAVVEELP